MALCGEHISSGNYDTGFFFSLCVCIWNFLISVLWYSRMSWRSTTFEHVGWFVILFLLWLESISDWDPQNHLLAQELSRSNFLGIEGRCPKLTHLPPREASSYNQLSSIGDKEAGVFIHHSCWQSKSVFWDALALQDVQSALWDTVPGRTLRHITSVLTGRKVSSAQN